MNRFVACMCVGLMVLLSPPRANAQDGKGQRFADVTAEAGVAGKVQGKGWRSSITTRTWTSTSL
jgi:hypothetical protein